MIIRAILNVHEAVRIEADITSAKQTTLPSVMAWNEPVAERGLPRTFRVLGMHPNSHWPLIGGSTIPSQEYTHCSNSAATELLKASMGLPTPKIDRVVVSICPSCLTLEQMNVI